MSRSSRSRSGATEAIFRPEQQRAFLHDPKRHSDVMMLPSSAFRRGGRRRDHGSNLGSGFARQTLRRGRGPNVTVTKRLPDVGAMRGGGRGSRGMIGQRHGRLPGREFAGNRQRLMSRRVRERNRGAGHRSDGTGWPDCAARRRSEDGRSRATWRALRPGHEILRVPIIIVM